VSGRTTTSPNPPAGRAFRLAGRSGLLLLAAAGLAAFYVKYVPLIPAFQLALTPFLALAAFLGWRDLRRGILFVLFAFPLINSLPYFFGIHEPLPHAPAALVLCLFLLLGALFGGRRANGGADEALPAPYILFGALVALSAAVTAARYVDFFPFLSPALGEWRVNSFGVTSGGAAMSVVFYALNYLTGLAFFVLLRKTLRPGRFPASELAAAGTGIVLSLGFAFYQHFGHPAAGNNPTSLALGLINGTYKDALSLGAYLSMAVPLFGGVFLSCREVRMKVLAGLVIVPSGLVIVWSGSKIGIAGLLAAMAALTLFALQAPVRTGAGSRAARPRKYASFLVGLLFAAGAIAVLAVSSRPAGGTGRTAMIVERFRESGTMLRWRVKAMWTPALAMMADYPLTGVGVGGFTVEVPHYTDIYKKETSVIPESAENHALQAGAEMGWPALLLLFWIGWDILRRFLRGWRAPAASVTWDPRLLAAGAFCGILAFLANAQMHSYIGSYEVKYLLWFLIALVFLPSSARPEAVPPIPEARNATRRRRWRAVSLALLLALAAVHFWNSTHSLSLQSRTETFKLVQEFGLWPTEKTPDGREFRWTGKWAGFPVEIARPVLIVPLQAAHPDIMRRPVRVRFDLVESLSRRPKRLGQVVLTDNAWTSAELPVPPSAVRKAVLLVTVSRTWNPRRALGAPDRRHLGVAVGTLRFQAP
jgi:hypothetical protein